MAGIRFVRQVREIVRIPLPLVVLAWFFAAVTRHYLVTLSILAFLYFQYAPISDAFPAVLLIMFYFVFKGIFFWRSNRHLQTPVLTRIPAITAFSKIVFPAFTVPTLLAGAYYIHKLRHRWGDGAQVSYLTVPKRYKVTRFAKLRQIRIDPNSPTLLITALIKMNRSGHTAYEFVTRQDALAAILKADWVHITEIEPHLASIDVDWRSFAPHPSGRRKTPVPSKFSKPTTPATPTPVQKSTGAVNIDKGTGTLF